MMKVSFVSILAAVFILIGAGAIKLIDQNQSFQRAKMKSSDEKTVDVETRIKHIEANRLDAKTAVQKAELEKPYEATEKDEGVDRGESRLSKIATLVRTSMDKDSEQLSTLEGRIAELKSQMAGLYEEKKIRSQRLIKLKKIRRVIGDHYFNGETEVTPRELAKAKTTIKAIDSKIEDHKSFLAKVQEAHGIYELSAIKAYNAFAGKDKIILDAGEAQARLHIDGKSLLIFDDRPIRVGTENAQFFEPVVEEFTSKFKFKKAVIKVSSESPRLMSHSIAEYLKRMYNWNVEIKRTDEMGGPLNVDLEIIGESKSAYDDIRFDDDTV